MTSGLNKLASISFACLPIWSYSITNPSKFIDVPLFFLLHSSETLTFFHKELENLDAVEGDTVTLRCELSKPGVSVEWRKGGVVLQPGKKFQLKQEGCVQELCIYELKPEDSGYYTCDAGDQLTTASVSVQGNEHLLFTSALNMSRLVAGWIKVVAF